MVAANASLTERINCVFMGTSVRSGTARVLIVQTAKAHGVRSDCGATQIAPARDGV